MAALKKGDKCPCCGEPIQTDDPLALVILAAFGLKAGTLTANDFNENLLIFQKMVLGKEEGDPHA